MKKPVFRFQIAALATRDRKSRRQIIASCFEGDALLKKYRKGVGATVMLVIFLLALLTPNWDSRHAYGPIFHIGFGVLAGGIVAAVVASIWSLFFINPRLKEILDR